MFFACLLDKQTNKLQKITIIKIMNPNARKIVSMIRKYHNRKPQTNPWHREEEPHNHHETPGRQSNLTLLHVNKKDADQTAHPCSLISVFVALFLNCLTSKLPTCAILMY